MVYPCFTHISPIPLLLNTPIARSQWNVEIPDNKNHGFSYERGCFSYERGMGLLELYHNLAGGVQSWQRRSGGEPMARPSVASWISSSRSCSSPLRDEVPMWMEWFLGKTMGKQEEHGWTWWFNGALMIRRIDLREILTEKKTHMNHGKYQGFRWRLSRTNQSNDPMKFYSPKYVTTIFCWSNPYFWMNKHE